MKLNYEKRPGSISLGDEIKAEIGKTFELYLTPSRAIVRAFKRAVKADDLKLTKAKAELRAKRIAALKKAGFKPSAPGITRKRAKPVDPFGEKN